LGELDKGKTRKKIFGGTEKGGRSTSKKLPCFENPGQKGGTYKLKKQLLEILASLVKEGQVKW